LCAAPALAHHSFAAEYDAARPITAQGTVLRFAWANPHAYLYVSVKDENGKFADWQFEMGSPNSLQNCGLTRRSIKAGDVITVVGYRAKDGGPRGYAVEVKRGDGRTIYSRPKDAASAR
jgi:hypothetical protein